MTDGDTTWLSYMLSTSCCTSAVFTVAEFYMEYQLVYTVPTCDYQLFNLKQQQLHEFVCQKSVEKCPFHTTASCHHLTSNVGPSHPTRAADPVYYRHNKKNLVTACAVFRNI